MLDKNAFPPIREHVTDAGMDIRALESGIVRARDSRTFRTGLHVELPSHHAGLFVSRSGLMVKHDITSTGLVDEGFNGEIMVKLFNHGNEDFFVHRGDKIGQLVIMPVLYEPVEIVNSIKGGDRGSDGFGSTDRSRHYAKGGDVG